MEIHEDSSCIVSNLEALLEMIQPPHRNIPLWSEFKRALDFYKDMAKDPAIRGMKFQFRALRRRDELKKLWHACTFKQLSRDHLLSRTGVLGKLKPEMMKEYIPSAYTRLKKRKKRKKDALPTDEECASVVAEISARRALEEDDRVTHEREWRSNDAYNLRLVGHLVRVTASSLREQLLELDTSLNRREFVQLLNIPLDGHALENASPPYDSMSVLNYVFVYVQSVEMHVPLTEEHLEDVARAVLKCVVQTVLLYEGPDEDEAGNITDTPSANKSEEHKE